MKFKNAFVVNQTLVVHFSKMQSKAVSQLTSSDVIDIEVGNTVYKECFILSFDKEERIANFRLKESN